MFRHERRIELAGEALYYHDVLRWKTADDVLNVDLFNVRVQRINDRSFNPARDYLWPIPTAAMQANPALQQNPVYGN